MSDCRQCADFDWCAEHEDCGLFKPKPITNADRIRAMTDKELAIYLHAKTCEDGYPQFDTVDGWLDWLRKEINDGESD